MQIVLASQSILECGTDLTLVLQNAIITIYNRKERISAVFKMTMKPGKTDEGWMSIYEYVGAYDVIEMIKGTSLSQGFEEIRMTDDADVGMHFCGYSTDNFEDFYNWYDWEVGDLTISWKNRCSLHVNPSERNIFFWSPDKSLDLNVFFANAKKL